MILVPAFAVPVAVLLHLFALARLVRDPHLGAVRTTGVTPRAAR